MVASGAWPSVSRTVARSAPPRRAWVPCASSRGSNGRSPTRATFVIPVRPWRSSATTTSCRPMPISTRCARGERMHSCNRNPRCVRPPCRRLLERHHPRMPSDRADVHLLGLQTGCVPRDAGMHLDHLLLSEGLVARTTAAGVDRTVRGRENASDHAPAWVSLTD